MFCPKCGAENSDDAKFCAKCGAEMGVSAKPAKGAAKPKAETSKTEVETSKPEAESSTGMSANTAGLLCYVAGWITGIVFAVLEKKSKVVKFHAWQSIMTFGVLSVVQLIVAPILSGIAVATFSPGLLVASGVLSVIVWVVTVGFWIALMVLAGTGKMWKVPWAGKWAEKRASK